MVNFEKIMSGITAVFDRLNAKVEKIKSMDRITLSCIVTGIVFLIFALIQIIIIALDSAGVKPGNVTLIVIDLIVSAISALITVKRSRKSDCRE